MSAKEMSDRAEKIARLKELEKKATAKDHNELYRYEHGGGRLLREVEVSSHLGPRPDRVLIADFYNEADREHLFFLRNEALAIIEEQEREIERLNRENQQLQAGLMLKASRIL